MSSLSYPIGEFQRPQPISQEHIAQWIQIIEQFPGLVEKEVTGLTAEELRWKYRPEGWSIHQLIHHCADSHMNAFIRFKLALTEEKPAIRPYFEDRWAKLPDTLEVPFEVSLNLLNSLHHRWCVLLKNLTTDDLLRTYVHPEHGKEFTLDDAIGQYGWHCEHHLAHIKQAKKAAGDYN